MDLNQARLPVPPGAGRSRVHERTDSELHILEMQKHAFLVRLFPAEETKRFCGLEHGHAGA